VQLDDALRRHEAVPARDELPITSWGTPRDLHTWSGPQVADLAWAARDAELALVGALERAGGADGEDGGALPAATRELLLAQSSDWAFMVTRALAAPYGRRRAEAHTAAVRRLLDSAR
jgi:1,4-alpha-glucan branching enzyme